VLEDRKVDRIGAARSIEVDVRVVAASNRDLAEQVRRGQFREDLYYRLSVITIVVPPLRDRPDDVPLLAEHFLARFRASAARRIRGFAPAALRALAAHAWPGNVRELRNAVERAVVLGAGEWIEAEDLPDHVAVIAPRPRTPTPPMGSMALAAPLATIAAAAVDAPAGAARSLRDLERDGIVAALAATGGNKARAAAILEIDRSTLYKKLKDYGLE
jgi:two-component system response regulator HydG